MTRPFSIRRFLFVSLLLVTAAGMAVSAWWSWRVASHEVTELFDAQLAQSARVLAATLASRPLLPEADDADTVVFPAWRGDASPEDHEDDGEDEKKDDGKENGGDAGKRGKAATTVPAGGHAYESRLMFQLWEGHGERLLMRSSNAPLGPLQEFRAGYGTVRIGTELYHVFSLEYEGLFLQVAQDHGIRQELVGRIATATLVPHLAGMIAMVLLVWFAVGRGMRPLMALRAALSGRDARNLAPVAPASTSVELQPLVDELNGLLARLDESFLRERRFTADAAHELRTPLAVLRIQAENARASVDDEAREQSLDMLLRGVDRAVRIVEQLLTLARLDPEAAGRQFQTVALDAVVREELAAQAPLAAPRRQEIEFDTDGEHVVHGDAVALGILVRNLVDNALRYSPEGSCVRVSLEAAGSDRVVLTVTDEGVGVSEAQIERIFERFFRGETGRGDGAGLGLAIVRRIADLHGGKVSVRPRRGEVPGAFIVDLPSQAGARTVRRVVPPELRDVGR